MNCNEVEDGQFHENCDEVLKTRQAEESDETITMC